MRKIEEIAQAILEAAAGGPAIADRLPKQMEGREREEHEEEESYAEWVELVDRIRINETDGMEEFYQLFSKGIRFYLCRQLGPQELDDKVHDTFVVVVQAIRRGELREPSRLMGFVRTIVRRQVAAHIDKVVHTRRDQIDLDSTVRSGRSGRESRGKERCSANERS